MKLLSHIFRIVCMAALIAGTCLSTNPADHVHAAVELLGATITVPTNADNTTTGSNFVVTTTAVNTSDTLCSLQEAMINANADAAIVSDCPAGSGKDRITFADNISTITLSFTAGDITDTDGLTINGGGDVTISGNNAVRIFFVGSSAALTLESITLREGWKPVSGGGAIQNDGTLTILDSHFNKNNADFGGGIYNTGILNITNSSFESNSTTQGGNAILSTGTMTITNSTFAQNSGTTGDSLSTLYNAGTGSVTNSTFYSNSSAGGSAIYNVNGGVMTINTSTFVDNIGSEGVIHNTGIGSKVGIFNSTFYHNESGVGKGVINNQAVMAITNSTFSRNGISGGLDIIQDASLSAEITLQNNIFANSLGGGHCVIGQGTITAHHNLMEDTINKCQLSNGIDGNIIGSDPQLGPLTGSPAYLPLNSSSPAINAGFSINDITTSQNGVARPSGANFDMGSFELPVTTLTVTSSAINDGWILESKETSGKGLTMNNAAATFNLGDDPADRQYRAILHFDTSSLPNTAAIVSATLKIKKKSLAGMDPFNILGNLNASIRKPAFGTAALAATDFKSAAGKNNVASFGGIPIGAWYAALINNTGRLYINRSGSTQFRLSFAIDDNDNNSNDHMKFYSGNAGAANRPQLIIEYTIPLPTPNP